MKESKGDQIWLVFVRIICLFAAIITLYPFVYVASMSISDPKYVLSQEIWLFPRGFSLEAYKMIFANPLIWKYYYNTLWYAVVGTSLNVVLTILGGYPLSRIRFSFRKSILLFIGFTMFFSGGLIPLFILVRNLGLYNNRLALILPGAVSAYYIIVARTFFQYNIPESLTESAFIDGANDFQVLINIVIPLSKPIIAVLVLFYAVGHWNGYFNAMIYLPNPDIQPLQLYLVRVLIDASSEILMGVEGAGRSLHSIQIKHATIIVAILPIICTYPFLQKYFVKGVMIGAIKG